MCQGHNNHQRSYRKSSFLLFSVSQVSVLIQGITWYLTPFSSCQLPIFSWTGTLCETSCCFGTSLDTGGNPCISHLLCHSRRGRSILLLLLQDCRYSESSSWCFHLHHFCLQEKSLGELQQFQVKNEYIHRLRTW